jgi:hypothetical protein
MNKLVYITVLTSLLYSCSITSNKTPEIISWDAKPVLIQLYDYPGYVDDYYAWRVMPKLVIYSDGTVIKTTKTVTTGDINKYDENNWINDIKTTKLSNEELCSILFHIQELGYFDYKLSTMDLEELPDIGSQGTFIDIWNTRNEKIYKINQNNSINAVNRYLFDYPYNNLHNYENSEVVLLIYKNDSLSGEGDIWPSELPMLEHIVNSREYNGGYDVVFSGEQAKILTSLFMENNSRKITENNSNYIITYRPLLPYENGQGVSFWHQSTFSEEPKITMQCKK